MGVVNHVANAANLARAELQGLDPSALNTVIDTARLRLLLNALIELAEPQAAVDVGASAARTQMGIMARFQDVKSG